MPDIIFENAKNSSLTCSINGKYLHSKYNPENEAENFVSNLNFDFKPEIILITEPGIGYVCTALKSRYPSSKIVAVRYSKSFSKWDNSFDYVFYADEENSTSLKSRLTSTFSENQLLQTAFIQWTPSSNLFSERNELVWNEIKEAVEYARTILFTSSYFSKRWFLNSLRLLKFSPDFYRIKKVYGPVIIAASGRSLETSIKYLQKFRKNFHLIALSSAVSVLIKNQIIPDLILTTDGGFWAKKHLEILKKHPDIPVAIALEGTLPFFLASTNPIIPLSYSDGFSSRFFSDFNFMTAERNGTVSGTAVEFALKLTDSKVYICGLDLACSKGYQHTMPNALEMLNQKADIRTKNQSTRNTRAELNSASLDIYKAWFQEEKRNFSERAFRLSDNFSFSNNLNTMKDVNFDQFEKDNNSEISTEFKLERVNTDRKIITKKVERELNENTSSEEWLKEFFPSEYLMMTRKKNDELKELQNQIKRKNDAFVNKIRKLI